MNKPSSNFIFQLTSRTFMTSHPVEGVCATPGDVSSTITSLRLGGSVRQAAQAPLLTLRVLSSEVAAKVPHFTSRTVFFYTQFGYVPNKIGIFTSYPGCAYSHGTLGAFLGSNGWGLTGGIRSGVYLWDWFSSTLYDGMA